MITRRRVGCASQTCACDSLPAPGNPWDHFQQYPELSGERHQRYGRVVESESRRDWFSKLMMKHGKVLGKRILLADDQEDVREMTAMLLGVDDHIVTTAINGREALDLFTPDRFDLVITDYLMPLMKGDELARNIKQLAPAEPVLMITGSASELGSIQASVDAVLNKPFGLEELRQAVAHILDPVLA